MHGNGECAVPIVVLVILIKTSVSGFSERGSSNKNCALSRSPQELSGVLCRKTQDLSSDVPPPGAVNRSLSGKGRISHQPDLR